MRRSGWLQTAHTIPIVAVSADRVLAGGGVGATGQINSSEKREKRKKTTQVAHLSVSEVSTLLWLLLSPQTALWQVLLLPPTVAETVKIPTTARAMAPNTHKA